MAKNRENKGLFDVSDLTANSKKQIDKINAQNTHDTQGTQRKQKHPRINMAFYNDNLEYVREAAYQSRMSVTEYINKLIVDDRERQRLQQQERTIQTPDGVLEQMNIDDVE